MQVGIQIELLKLNSLGLLEPLLQDKTTKSNILWGTDAYADLGSAYQKDRPITVDLITGEHSGVIKNRARKALEQQNERTRQHAEVFTPFWICEKMNNYADEVWFGQPDMFRKDGKPTDRVQFTSKYKWTAYVNARDLEITCGEAPYLVSRYDVSTGDYIPVPERIGLLDRKLRVVNEYAADETEWLTWATKAYQAIYGYEYQGDNLLISRMNLLLTFEEYILNRWRRKPTMNEYNKISNIITWNIWQMDGLTGTIPYYNREQENSQVVLEGWYIKPIQEISDKGHAESTYCLIKNWRQDHNIEFRHVTEGERKMKFDFVIGNPPYQEETAKKETSNGQKTQKNIFQYFQMQANKVAKKGSVLIYPAGRWIHQSGKGMKKFGYEQINDIKLKKVIFYQDAHSVFPEADIADGVSIVIYDMTKAIPGFEYIYISGNTEICTKMDNPGDSLMPIDPRDHIIVQKIDDFVNSNHLVYMNQNILPRSLFGIESNFVEKNADKVREFESDESIDFSHELKLFVNDKAGKAGRGKWYVVDKSLITSNADKICEWKVVVSSANAGGQKRDNQLEIIDNHSVFGRSRVALKSFKTREEAENFYKYMKTYIIRYAFLMTDEALNSLGKRVPDFNDYSNHNCYLDFHKDLDRQLINCLKLSEDEYYYIRNRVDSIRRQKHGGK